MKIFYPKKQKFLETILVKFYGAYAAAINLCIKLKMNINFQYRVYKEI